MKVKIIEATYPLVGYRAWKFSRPLDTKTTHNEVLKVDAPVNEFPEVILEVESTIIEREIFATMRDHVMWAQTSRVEDVRDFEVDVKTDFTESCREEMIQSSKNGEPQDRWRLRLPLVAKVKYMIRLNLRSLIKIRDYFVGLDFLDAAFCLNEVLTKIGIHTSLRYKPIEILKPVVDFQGDRATKVAHTATVEATCLFSLRTHMTRHRNIIMRDDLYDWIQDDIETEKCLNDVTRVQVTADIETWQQLYEKRACWIAQYSLWSTVLNPIADVLGIHKSSLPCKDGVCMYGADNQLRLEGKDPNPVCPIYADLENIPQNRESITSMRKMIDSEGRLEFWFDKVNEMPWGGE